jgi:hypothetical protein
MWRTRAPGDGVLVLSPIVCGWVARANSPRKLSDDQAREFPPLPGGTMLTGAGEPGSIGAFSGSIAPTAALVATCEVAASRKALDLVFPAAAEACSSRSGKTKEGRTQMRLGRPSLALAFLAVVGLCVVGTASSAGAQHVTTQTKAGDAATCTTPVQKGNVTFKHCTGGTETWFGDITGSGTYSYDRITNLTTNVRISMNAVETISNACVLGVCGGDLYSTWVQVSLPAGAPDSRRLEQGFTGGTGPFANAHGSIRLINSGAVFDDFAGNVGL